MLLEKPAVANLLRAQSWSKHAKYLSRFCSVWSTVCYFIYDLHIHKFVHIYLIIYQHNRRNAELFSQFYLLHTPLTRSTTKRRYEIGSSHAPANKRSSFSGEKQFIRHADCAFLTCMRLLVFSNFLLHAFLCSLFFFNFAFERVWVVCKIMFNFQIIFMCMIFMTMCRN